MRYSSGEVLVPLKAKATGRMVAAIETFPDGTTAIVRRNVNVQRHTFKPMGRTHLMEPAWCFNLAHLKVAWKRGVRKAVVVAEDGETWRTSLRAFKHAARIYIDGYDLQLALGLSRWTHEEASA